jgi:large subunit ribosomal protein L4
MKIVDMKGKVLEDTALSKVLFDDAHINEWLIHEYVVMYLANQRQSNAHSKTRGEVQNSGKKLYAQKWTGRARVGDAGSPIRRKGWVTFGPSNETNWSKAMPQKMRNKALLGALTLKAKSEHILGLQTYASKEGKTKETATMLKNIWSASKKTLLVLPGHDLMIERSLKNIEKVNYTTVNEINAYDVMSHKQFVFVGPALEALEQRVLPPLS